MQTEQLIVTGMHCGGCVTAVTRALGAVPGVVDVKVSLEGGAVTVRHDETATAEKLVSAIEGAGYGVAQSRGEQTRARKGCCGCGSQT